MLNEDDKRIERFERQAAEFSRHNLSVVATLNIPEGAEDFIRTTAGGQPLTSAMLTRVTEERRIVQNKKKEKDRHFNELKQLIDHLNERLEKIDQRLEEIDQELSEIDELERLAEQGLLDPNNPEHAKLMKKHNIKEKDIETGHIFAILGGRRSELETERVKLIEERQNVKEQLNNAKEINARIDRYNEEVAVLKHERSTVVQELERQHNENISLENPIDRHEALLQEKQALAEALEKAKENFRAGHTARQEQKNLETKDGVWGREELEKTLADAAGTLSVDQEIENFMKNFERVKEMEDPVERMAEEKRMVDALSAEAKDNLQFEDSTAHLFEEEYFKPLETEVTVAENMQLDSAPSLDV